MLRLRNDRCTRSFNFGRLPATAVSGGRIALTLLLLFYISGCARKNPQVAYDRAREIYRRGDIASAEAEAKRGYEEFHKVNRDWAWRFLILRADALHALSKDVDALNALASEPNQPASGELAIRLLRVQSAANAALGRARAAEEELLQAERLCAASDSPVCADVFGVRGRTEMERAHFESAQGFFEKGLASARAGGDRFREAASLLDLSWSANEQTHFDEALTWTDSARKICAREHFADIEQTAIGNMGWAYYRLGDREKARQMFLEAGKQAENLGDATDQASWLTNTGYTYLDDGNFEVAARYFRQSLDLAKKNNIREDISPALQALAFLSERTGQLYDARRYADEALGRARADGNKRDETYPRLVQGLIAAKQHDPAAAEAAFHEVGESADSPVFLKWEAEHSLARLYEDEKEIQRADAEYRTALSTFEAARSELHETSRLSFLSNATSIYDDYIHLLVTQGKTAEALQIADYSRARTLSEGLGKLKKSSGFHPDAVDAPAIARRAGGTILFYWLGEKQSYLWAATPQKLDLFSLPPAAEIEAAVQRYRKSLLGPEDALETRNSDGLALYHTLVAPAQVLLSKTGKVFIIPDGSLNTLNFETLLSPDPSPHYWIDDVTLADASSLRMLATARATGTARANLLLMGDAVATSSDYPPLRKASAEMDSIQKHFPAEQRAVLAREQATPAAYLGSQPGQFSYIHFVAHGTASRASPLDSAIVLSGTGADDSFKLYARDIIRQPLHAELVTISTCYGAGARAYSGEGLVGLSWAFLRAGAHDVIGALWEVSDVSTPQLMDALYGGLRQGQSPEAALRAAKLSLLHSGGAFRRPFYWAPFQVYTGS